MAHSIPSHPSAWNQQVYQRLKLAFELGLKRQIFVAVCDDWTQTDALAARLQSEIGPHLSRGPGLVSLNLQFNHPDPIAQIRRWLQRRSPPLSNSVAHVPQPLTSARQDILHHTGSNDAAWSTPGFQILGVETLIRQSAAVQWSFLSHMRRLPDHLSELDSSILFWMSRPWRYTIARSTPEFWHCCSGIFEFTGEPIPRRITAVPMRDRGYAPEGAPPPFMVTSEQTTDAAIVATSSPSTQDTATYPDRSVPPTSQTARTEHFNLSFAELSQTIEPLLVANVQETRHLVASAAVDPRQVLVQLFELKHTQADAATLATTYQHLGTIYRDHLDAECPDLRCVMIAIQAYECALACWHQSPQVDDTRDRQLPVLANDIGTLYWMMADGVETTDDRILSLQRGEAAYRYTLDRLSEIEQPYAWATIQDNLGSLRSDLARMAPTTALQIQIWKEAIAAYRAALRHQLPELDPQQFATIHSNLGTACWNLAQVTEPVTYLEQAIQAYRVALDFFTAERDPLSYAMLQTNLGTAAWNLARHDRQRDRLHFAIRCYRAALVYRTAENHPTGYAATQNNLGTAYWNLAETFDIRQEREALIANLRDAIQAYEQAIAIAAHVHNRTDLALSFDLHATYDNLGMAYAYLGACLSRMDDAPERLRCYEQAVACYVRAIEGYGTDDPRYDSILNELTATLRSLHDREGLNAQNRVFSSIPGPLLADVMRRL